MRPEYIDIAYALGVGILVGLERQHSEMSREPEQPEDTPLGVRTFALLSLLGWLTRELAGALPWLPVGVVGLAGALLVSQHLHKEPHERVGITTEIAALLTLVLGMLVSDSRLLAATVAVLATLILISKFWVGNVVSKLRRVEIAGTLQLLIAVAIVLPLLPAEAQDPWDALPPRAIGFFVVLIAGLNYIGYFLSRILGRQRGVGITGIVGGITSSTAVTATMALSAAKHPSLRTAGQLAVFLANAMSFVRVVVLAVAASREVAMSILPVMAAMSGVMLLASVWALPALRSPGRDAEGPELRNPFALLPALKWGLLLTIVLLISAIASDALGGEGLVVVAALSGLAEVSPITLAAARQAADGEVAVSLAALAITIAVIANIFVKSGIALFGGGRAFGAPVVAVFAVTSLVGVAVVLLM